MVLRRYIELVIRDYPAVNSLARQLRGDVVAAVVVIVVKAISGVAGGLITGEVVYNEGVGRGGFVGG